MIILFENKYQPVTNSEVTEFWIYFIYLFF